MYSSTDWISYEPKKSSVTDSKKKKRKKEMTLALECNDVERRKTDSNIGKEECKEANASSCTTQEVRRGGECCSTLGVVQ